MPSKKDFLQFIKNGCVPPLYVEIPYSLPYLIYESLASTNSFLLESIKGPEKIARFSFIGFDPCLIFKIKNGVISLISRRSSFVTQFFGRPLNILKELVRAYRQKPFEYLPPFQGGAVGILSYDFVQYLERLPKNAVDDLNLPDAHFLMIDKLITIDHLYKKCWIIVCPGAGDTIEREGERVDWSERYDEAEYEINEILSLVIGHQSSQSSVISHQSSVKTNDQIEIIYEMKRNDYMDIVKRAKEYIAAGDIFQANLSQRVSAHIGDISPWSLYRILSSINPSPFAAFMDLGDYQIVSSSPERLLRVKDGIIETRPIAGTRPRGKDTNEDELMRSELLLNEKERAEHIMLIDLERNDLGRVSDYGTVRVDELMITEDYSHVIHIVSNVKGKLVDGKDCFDAIKAAFPGGTITGVPKVRCMEIIDELEPVRRGPYTGSIGYISFSGNMDLNIVIRTFVIKEGMAYVQVGAGIVADSDPEREYYETLKKAEALIRTLERVK
ncbi:MAG: anthranilate synthase component I family protein [Nitrospirae bacterium]|nr:anthranilate synthase component I family protein [Nitrospirota bacterium]